MDAENPLVAPRIWQVGALCRAVADALESRFNPVAVCGEISGFARASSGHCYFSIKDESGQIRCAMFRRAASMVDFDPRDGQRVELRGRLGVYEARGDLQLVVESMRQAGQGAWYEQFLRLKAQLEAQGLFAPERKRALPLMPRAIGVVTSLGAAALHDVLTALARRVPHIPVVVSPAAVQGAAAPAELVQALTRLYTPLRGPEPDGWRQVDVILLVRGGGSIEDLWAFNDEQLARTVAQSPVPVISGVGHETDFTIADFVADLRAPTPTAAAELVAQPQSQWLGALDLMGQRLHQGAWRQMDAHSQRLDGLVAHLGRPSARLAAHQLQLAHQAQALRHGTLSALARNKAAWQALATAWPQQSAQALGRSHERLGRAALRLQLLDPRLVLQRGYAWLSDEAGCAITSAASTRVGQAVQATLADGTIDLTVNPPRLL